MKHLFRLMVVLGLAGSGSADLLAQPLTPAASPYTLRLASGDALPPANFAQWLQQPATPAPDDSWNGHVFRLVQFEHLPTQAQRLELRRRGVELFDYLPQRAYLAALPATFTRARLAGFGVRTVVPVAGAWKLAGALARHEVPAHARRGAGRLEVVASYYPALTPAQATQAAQAAGAERVGHDEFSRQLRLVVAEADLARLAALPWVSALEEAPAPGEPENFRGRTNHRANVLAADYGAGRHYTGAGVTVGHGDDGSIGPHIDFQGRVDVSTAGVSQGDHGDHVAGIIMGAGNLDPRQRGQATGAFNFYQSYPNNLNSTPTNYANAQRKVRITNSSYGDGNNTGYTSNARAMDQHMRQLPFLVHVFSAGNSGTSNFNYGAGAGWGNITGGHKMGKNVLTVGNVDYQDNLASSSSRGPTTDGRIKPDICAVGSSVTSTYGGNIYATISGTSMACPGTAGVLAQLAGAYRSLNTNAEAPGALLKAVLLNTAEDLGNPGPDFRFGYGRINALRAVRTLEGQTYFRDSLTQGQTRTFSIAVPAGKSQLRVLLHWTDYEGAIQARPNLVNDLELRLGAPGSSALLQPWVLDHRPTVAQLSTAAVAGRDSLNNTEQITVEAPTAGTYTVTVNGRAVPQGKQGFWVTYAYLEPGVELTYPLGGEGVVPGETEVIRWDAASSAQPFALDYSADNGTTWTSISANVAGTRRHFDWVVPAGLSSGQMRVRVTQAGATSASAAAFSASALPLALRSEYRCGPGVGTKLTWTAVPGCTSYTVYRLGAMYMDSVTTVTTPFAVLPTITSATAQWFAVRGRGANGLLTRRTRAVFQAAGDRDCPGPPQVAFAASQAQICPGGIVALTDSSQSYPTSWQWTVSPTTGVTYAGGTTAASRNPQLQFATAGTYSVTLSATNSLGTAAVTQSGLITVTTGQAGPFAEAFRGMTTAAAFPPANWRVVNPSSNFTWQLSPTAVMGPDTVSRRLPQAPDYIDPLRNVEDYLITPVLNLASVARPSLSFAVAYAAYGASNPDGLRVDISLDCGQTFQPTGYLKTGAVLATVPGVVTSSFSPTSASQWRLETVDLSTFRQGGTGAQPVLLRFANINQYGNNLYLANVRLAAATALASRAGTQAGLRLVAHPVPFGASLQVQAEAIATTPGTLELLDALGRSVRRLPDLLLRPGQPQTLRFDTAGLPAGLYVLQLRTATGIGQQLKVVKE